jgi:regulator of sigma E protease
MFVVSAGVIMNIILAAIGFMIVFRMGFRVQAPVIGTVLSNSPAAQTAREDGTAAPLQVGDRILMYDGKWQHDFTKITLNVALSREGKVPLYVEHPDASRERLLITPERAPGDINGFLDIGVRPAQELRGLDVGSELSDEVLKSGNPKLFVSADALAVMPGEHIAAINGEPIQDPKKDHWKLGKAIRESNGEPVQLTVVDKDGKSRQESVRPRFTASFGMQPISFAGMVPRAGIEQVTTESSAKGKLFPGDVILAMDFKNGDRISNPTVTEVRARLENAGKTAQPVSFRVLRDGQEVLVPDLIPNVRIDKGVYGLGVQLSIDDRNPVVAETVEKSPAQAAGIPDGAKIVSINAEPVKNWFVIKRILSAAKPGESVKIVAETGNGRVEREMKLGSEEIGQIAGLYYTHPLTLHDLIEPRKTDSLAVAAAWGVTETRDFVLQFYLTLHRMFTGRVSYKNMMGPVGIFNAGRQFAYKGTDWLIWFLAMISANLAVVNFLPIPIVDGGLFTFLIVEKIQGRPLSAKTQSIAQVVGLAIILSVFLLVTYQDIARLAL